MGGIRDRNPNRYHLCLISFLERDAAKRIAPCEDFAWDGVAEVKPYAKNEEKIVEGVY